MSGTAVPTFTASSGGDVSIVINGNQIAGWETVQIVRSAESFPNSFALTLTEEFSNDPTRILAEPGAPCQVFIGKFLALTGYVDRYTASIHPGGHDVEIVGRGLGEDLVDCSADLLSPDSPVKGGSTSASSALDLTQKLCKPFGILARSNVDDLGRPIPVFQVALGETSFEIIERTARYAGYLVYEDTIGDVILDRVGTRKMASGFAQGVNVEAAASSLSFDQRYSIITTVYNTVDTYSEGSQANVTNKRAQITDSGVVNAGRFRPRITVSAQTDGSQDFAQRMANWEMARRIGRSQSVQLTCDSWFDSAGALWKPNWLADVNLPALKIVNATWIIGTVVFRKDQSGTHADLTLMPPDAFSIQPSTLNIWDREMTQGIPTSQNPAPPNTSPFGAS